MNSRTLTIESTTPEKTIDLTIGLEQTHLRLKAYRVDLAVGATNCKTLGIQLGTTNGSNYLVDGVLGSYLFRLPIDSGYPLKTIDGVDTRSTFVSGCDIPYTLQGQLDKVFAFKVFKLDNTTNTFSIVSTTDLKYISLVFEAF